MNVLNQLVALVQMHWVAISTVSAYVAVTVINCLPKPGMQFQWYPFIYDVLTSLAARKMPPSYTTTLNLNEPKP